MKKIFSSIDERDKRILEFIDPGKNNKILIIGTGVFPKVEYILFNNFQCKDITSGDIDKKNIENGKEILPELNFIYLDAQKKFPFKASTFDRVILTEVLEHLNDEYMALSEIRRVLKPKGALIISVPKKRWFSIFSPIFWVQHKREYSERSIKQVLEKNGFKTEKMFVGGSIYDLLNLWVHLIYKHIFRRLYLKLFFQKQINDHYKKEFNRKGIDIIIRAKK